MKIDSIQIQKIYRIRLEFKKTEQNNDKLDKQHVFYF